LYVIIKVHSKNKQALKTPTYKLFFYFFYDGLEKRRQKQVKTRKLLL